MDTADVNVIARGSYLDRVDTDLYLVEAITLRLSPEALNGWILSETHDYRDCYEDGEAGEKEWRLYLADCAKKREDWETDICRRLHIDQSQGSVCITQSLAEIFTVVHITLEEEHHGE